MKSMKLVRFLATALFIVVPLLAAAYDIPSAGEQAFGHMSPNPTSNLSRVNPLVDPILYLFGLIFFCDFIRRIILLAKNSGDAWRKVQGLAYMISIVVMFTYHVFWIVVMFIASIFCFVLPAVLGSGMTTIFGGS